MYISFVHKHMFPLFVIVVVVRLAYQGVGKFRTLLYALNVFIWNHKNNQPTQSAGDA